MYRCRLRAQPSTKHKHSPRELELWAWSQAEPRSGRHGHVGGETQTSRPSTKKNGESRKRSEATQPQVAGKRAGTRTQRETAVGQVLDELRLHEGFKETLFQEGIITSPTRRHSVRAYSSIHLSTHPVMYDEVFWATFGVYSVQDTHLFVSGSLHTNNLDT